jgi:CelD/BcsL family acetyltransferase involved in cellulose biosynthesis
MGLSWISRLEDVPPGEWDAVLSRSRRSTPFLSRRFLLPWARAFAAGREKRVCRWERGGRSEGFLFLCRCGGGPEWELLGGEQVADSLDAVVAAGSEAEFWREFLAEARGSLADEGPLRLANLVEGSPSLSALPGVCRELGYRFRVEEMDRSPFVPLPGDFEEYLARLGKKERHELRRKLRRASEALPRLSYRVTSSREELDADFASFVSLHRLSHAEKEKFMDGRMERFFREIAEGFFAAGRLRLAFLSDGKADLASAFQIEWDGAILLYNSGFDPRTRELSPGVVLLARCIEDAIRRGRREYDFLRGRERYKYDLGGKDRVVHRADIRLP